MMGDFGLLDRYNTGGYYIDKDYQTRPAHEVKLDSYSIGRYQITFHDYLIYRQAKGLASNPYPLEGANTKTPTNNFYHEIWTLLSTNSTLSPEQSKTPAYLPWEAANDYCQWLGEQTGLPYSLPTEAQWEYAARNRGQFVQYVTDNGEYELGRNLPTQQQLEARAQLVNYAAGGDVFPVGHFPPSPLGLYDMDANGYEWMKDWYTYNYYQKSPIDNPQGGDETSATNHKVIRSNSRPTDTKVIVSRAQHHLTKQFDMNKFDNFYYVTARCAVNSSSPILTH